MFEGPLVLFIAFGALLLILATWLTTTKGNTISEIMNSDKFANAEAMKIEVLDKFKGSTMIPIVALYALGVAAPIVGIFVFMYGSTPKDTSETVVTGTFVLPTGSNASAIFRKLCLQPERTSLDDSGAFQVPVLNIDEPHNITVQGRETLPVTLSVDLKTQSVVITDTSGEPVFPLVAEGKIARIKDPIQLTASTSTLAAPPPNAASRPVTTSDPNLQPPATFPK